MSLCDDVVAAAADVAGAEAAAEHEAAALDVVAAAETEVADEVVVAHTHPPTDSFPAVAAAALQMQARYPTPMAVAFAVDPDSAQVEPHTRDTSRTAAEAGRMDYAGAALGAGPVGASRMALAAHTAQAGVVGTVVEAAAILSVLGTTRNSRKGLEARELGVVRSGVGSRLEKM